MKLSYSIHLLLLPVLLLQILPKPAIGINIAKKSIRQENDGENKNITLPQSSSSSSSSASVSASANSAEPDTSENESVEPDSPDPNLYELSVDPSQDFASHPNFDLLPTMSECGRSWSKTKNQTRKKRIVGGKLAKLGKFPWIGRLELYEGGSGNSTERCGSSLINSRYVLTAAHCVTKVPSGHSLSSVSFGTVDVRKKKQCVDSQEKDCTGRTRYDIEDIIIHEDYITGSLLNDIALIRLTEEVNYDSFVQPVCLPKNESLLRKWKNNKLTVAGFGRANGDDDTAMHYPSLLHEVDLPILPRADCETFYKRKTGRLDKSRFCAGGEAEKGDCRGDSGGPLMKTLPIRELSGQERVVQFGLVSYGHCALEGVPGGYINILYYMPWILDNMEP